MMNWTPGKLQHIEIDGVSLECIAHGPPPAAAPTLVLLHEGLGCVAMWRDFPERLAERTGLGVFAYSRQGYGGSDPCSLPRPVDYMEREARDVLGKLLDAAGLERVILFGHSDGGTIAGLYLGTHQDHRVRGLILMAPHFFVEPENLVSIRQIRETYATADLRRRLARYHGDNVDCAFHGWSETWLDPRFAEWDVRDAIAYVRVPVLYIQGCNDSYGSAAQADAVVEECYAPVEVHLLPDCEHWPHLEQTERTLDLAAAFTARLARIEATAVAVQ